MLVCLDTLLLKTNYLTKTWKYKEPIGNFRPYNISCILYLEQICLALCFTNNR